MSEKTKSFERTGTSVQEQVQCPEKKVSPAQLDHMCVYVVLIMW